MRAVILVLLVIAIVSTSVFADSATTRPATQPTAHANPAAAFDALIKAFAADDLEGVRASFSPAKDSPMSLEESVAYFKAIHRLNAATRKRFGEGTTDVLPSEQMLLQVPQFARLVIKGDDAAFVQGDGPDAPRIITFKKLDEGWKVAELPVTSTSIDPPNVFTRYARVIEETAKEVEAGKLDSAEQVGVRVSERMNEQRRS